MKKLLVSTMSLVLASSLYADLEKKGFKDRVYRTDRLCTYRYR
jgi:hypothetical protein